MRNLVKTPMLSSDAHRRIVTRSPALPEAGASDSRLSRRRFGYQLAGLAIAGVSSETTLSAPTSPGNEFSLNYILGSPMYGTAPLAEVVGEAAKVGARAIDIWPRRHANHREQMDELGHDRVAELLREHDVQLGVITRYDLGPYRLAEEMSVLRRFGGKLLVCGAKTPAGDTPRERVRKFVQSMADPVAMAADHGLTIGIENHQNSLLETPDSVRWFAEFATAPNLGLAMAPYHLPQDPTLIATLIEELGEKLVFFQAWQHGKGCMKKLPKEEELLQMPGRGSLDFRPLLAALAKIDYRGWTEIFMHPVPRGIPIRATTAAVTDEINRSRQYLEQCLADVRGG